MHMDEWSEEQKLSVAKNYVLDAHDKNWKNVIEVFEKLSGVKIYEDDVNLYKISPKKFHEKAKIILKCAKCGNEVAIDNEPEVIEDFKNHEELFRCSECFGKLILIKGEL